MPTTPNILGHSIPAATIATDVYVVPALTHSIISSIVVCNQTATDATYRVAVRKAAVALTAMQYIAYDATVMANDSVPLTYGATMGPGDIITVLSSSGTVSFNVFGVEQV